MRVYENKFFNFVREFLFKEKLRHLENNLVREQFFSASRAIGRKTLEKSMDFDRYTCVCTEYIIRRYTQRVSTVQLHFLPCSRKGDPRRIRRRGSSRGSHISRSKSTMGFEAGQRMRAISVYSGRIVIYNGGEADVRLRGMNVPVAGYKSTVSLWQRRSSRISCATRVIPAGKRLGYIRASNPALSIPPLRSHLSDT